MVSVPTGAVHHLHVAECGRLYAYVMIALARQTLLSGVKTNFMGKHFKLTESERGLEAVPSQAEGTAIIALAEEASVT